MYKVCDSVDQWRHGSWVLGGGPAVLHQQTLGVPQFGTQDVCNSVIRMDEHGPGCRGKKIKTGKHRVPEFGIQ